MVKMIRKSKKRSAPPRSRTTFGAVARINTAPVAIGNSVMGCASQVRNLPNGCVISGRDFMFSPIGTENISNWTLCGGAPLAPAAFVDSTISRYLHIYQKFRWRKCTVHYITSSATSSTGDVMFYYQKNRSSVFLSQTSSNLLPFVISDPDTVMGPQWTNHTADLTVTSNWLSTDYGMHADVDAYSAGEVYLLSKTTTTDAPGYVLFDYVVEFSQLQISPRLTNLPIPRCIFHQTNLGVTTFATVTTNDVVLTHKGNNLSGVTATQPPGWKEGDIYKCIVDITNSNSGAWTGTATTPAIAQPTPSNIFAIQNSQLAAGDSGFTLVDGSTFYVVRGADLYYCYTSIAAAYAGNADFRWGFNSAGTTPTVTLNLQVWLSFVGSRNALQLNPAI